MNTLNIILILAVLGLGFWVWKLKREVCRLEEARRVEVEKGEESPGSGIGKVSLQRSEKKQENLRKILEFVAEQERIANDDVEKLLGVSDATAERYLDELERAGKLQQVGKAGKHVFYQFK